MHVHIWMLSFPLFSTRSQLFPTRGQAGASSAAEASQESENSKDKSKEENEEEGKELETEKESMPTPQQDTSELQELVCHLFLFI